MLRNKTLNKFLKVFLAILIVLSSFANINVQKVIAEGNGIFASSYVPSVEVGGNIGKVDPELSISISDISTLESATVIINNVKQGDKLHFSNQSGITGNYNETNGVLTLSGNATLQNYQAALRSVEFSTTSTNLEERLIVFTIGNALYFEPTQHFYEFVPAQGISWKEAKLAAEERNLYGRQGYLATITSEEENNFVKEKTTGQGWIGASDDYETLNEALGSPTFNSQADAEGKWHWVTGPEKGTQFWSGAANGSSVGGHYHNWLAGEPNNNGSEHFAHIFGPTPPHWGQYGKWNDFSNTEPVNGYIVEYGGLPTDSIKSVTITMNKTLYVVEEVTQTTAPSANNILANVSDQTVEVFDVPSDTTVKLYIGEEEVRTETVTNGHVIFTDITLTPETTVHVTFTEANKAESDKTAKQAQARSTEVEADRIMTDVNTNKVTVKNVLAHSIVTIYNVDTNEKIGEYATGPSNEDAIFTIPNLLDLQKIGVTITKKGELESFVTMIQVTDSSFINPGFEQNLEGWKTYGTVTSTTGGVYSAGQNQWTVEPYQTKMAVLIPSGSSNVFNLVSDELLLSEASKAYILGQFPNTTNFAYIYQDIQLGANESFTMSWNYIATDYSPFNDASFVSFVNIDNPTSVPIVNGVKADVGILGATVLGTGNYSTGDYGSTGWQTASLTADIAGTYRLGFVVFNLSDTALSPYLFVDQEPGITLKNGEPFGPIEKDPTAPPPPGEVEKELTNPPNEDAIIANATDGTVQVKEVPNNTTVKLYKGDELLYTEENVDGTVVFTNVTLNEGETIQVTFTEEDKEESLKIAKAAQVRSQLLKEEDIIANATTNEVHIQNVPANAIVKVYSKEGDLIGFGENENPETSTITLSTEGMDVGKVDVTVTTEGKLESEKQEVLVKNQTEVLLLEKIRANATTNEIIVKDVPQGATVTVYNMSGDKIGEATNGSGSDELIITASNVLDHEQSIQVTLKKPGELESEFLITEATYDPSSAPMPEDIVVNATDNTVDIQNVPAHTTVNLYKFGEDTPIQIKENVSGTIQFVDVPLEEGEIVQVTYTFPKFSESERAEKVAQVRSNQLAEEQVLAESATNVVHVRNVPSGASVIVYDVDGIIVLGEEKNETGQLSNLDIIIYNKSFKTNQTIQISIIEVDKLESKKMNTKAINIAERVKERYVNAGGTTSDIIFMYLEVTEMYLENLLENEVKDRANIKNAVLMVQNAIESLENASKALELANAVKKANEALDKAKANQERYTKAGGSETSPSYKAVKEAELALEEALAATPPNTKAIEKATKKLVEAIEKLEEESKALELENAIQTANEAKDKAKKNQERYTKAGGSETDALYKAVEEAKSALEEALSATPQNTNMIEKATKKLVEAIEKLEKASGALELENAIQAANVAKNEAKVNQERYTKAGGNETAPPYKAVEEAKLALEEALTATPPNTKAIEEATKKLVEAIEKLEKASGALELENAIQAANEAKDKAKKNQERYTKAGGSEKAALYKAVEEAKSALEEALSATPQNTNTIEKATKKLVEAIEKLEKASGALELENAIQAANEAKDKAKTNQERYTKAGGSETAPLYKAVEKAKSALEEALTTTSPNTKAIEKATKRLIDVVNDLEKESNRIIKEKISKEIQNMRSIETARKILKNINISQLEEVDKSELYHQVVEAVIDPKRHISLEIAEDINSIRNAISQLSNEENKKQKLYVRLAEKSIQELVKPDVPKENELFQRSENKAIAQVINQVKDVSSNESLTNLHRLHVDTLSLTKEKAFMFVGDNSWESITVDFQLLLEGDYGSSIYWKSSNSNIILPNGKMGKVNRQNQDRSVIMTAEIKNNNQHLERTFLLVVKSKLVGDIVVEDSRRLVNINMSSNNTNVSAIQRINLLARDSGLILSSIDKLVVDDSIIPAYTTENITIYLSDDKNNLADELAIEIPFDIVQRIAGDLIIKTDQGILSLSKESLLQIQQEGIELFFRIVPLRDKEEKSRVWERLVLSKQLEVALKDGKEVKILGTPREIETNYNGFDTEVILPLDDVLYDGINLDMLRIFIEHTDGETKVVQGEIVYEEGQPIGIKFTINKFSTFTIFEMVSPEEVKEENIEDKVDSDDKRTESDTEVGEDEREGEGELDNDQKEEDLVTEEDNKKSTELPNTATSVYNILLIGVISLFVGLFLLIVRTRRDNLI
ncbi:immunoglobulin-like domain-containing protein [Alkalihalobacillus sp. 1P02AB]|uniref:immunoglobulin-like domain-containing protein n=1 Tax=Alkalihalobacillus sp. 1P02AB TaxID=3132260 RepID=UPI0039A47EEF